MYLKSGDFNLLRSQSRKGAKDCRCNLGNRVENKGGSKTADAHHVDAVVLNEVQIPAKESTFRNINWQSKSKWSTGLGKRVVPRLRELASRGQRESGGGIHAT